MFYIFRLRGVKLDYSGNEVDFVVLRSKAVHELIQVTYAPTPSDVPEREIKALKKAAKALNLSSGKVITWDVEETITTDGVTIAYIPLWRWLGKYLF